MSCGAWIDDDDDFAATLGTGETAGVESLDEVTTTGGGLLMVAKLCRTSAIA